MVAWSAVPSGASTGEYEAVELRDGGERYFGKGVQKAIDNIHKIISPAIIGQKPQDQNKIDTIMQKLDGTINKERLGANAILAVSMAVARLGAIVSRRKLYEHIAILSGETPSMPRPFFNIINGGVHAGNELAVQECMISPRAHSYAESYRIAAEVYHSLKEHIVDTFGKSETLIGDEGGFAPLSITTLEDAFSLVLESAKRAGYEDVIEFGIDVAASEFYVKEKDVYNFGFKTPVDDNRTHLQMIKYYKSLVKRFPIVSIEDPFDQNAFNEFAELKKILSDIKPEVQVVGDDLTVTNVERINTAISNNSCNSLLLKLNQIGTVTEAIAAHMRAKDAGWTTMVSHRSGETTDDFIADFAVGIGAEQVKFGSVARGERVVKYNRLISIENILK
jgi:enolase